LYDRPFHITRVSAGSNLTITVPHHLKHHRDDEFMRKYAHDIAMACLVMQPMSTNLHSLKAIMQVSLRLPR
jgi:hypothetical protein